jgi:hypothetical protein
MDEPFLNIRVTGIELDLEMRFECSCVVRGYRVDPRCNDARGLLMTKRPIIWMDGWMDGWMVVIYTTLYNSTPQPPLNQIIYPPTRTNEETIRDQPRWNHSSPRSTRAHLTSSTTIRNTTVPMAVMPRWLSGVAREGSGT